MKLSELITTSEVTIPGTDIVIRLKTELSWFDQLVLEEISDKTEQGKFIAERLIESWNITDDNEKPLPVSKETLGRLPAKVVLPIFDRILELTHSSEVKKKT